MASSTRSELQREREEERRLNKRTLVIASAASATAAAVTSQLWIHGTWLAAALTPVLVALISEAVHRPTQRIARAWTSERPALGTRAAGPAEPVAPPHGDPLQPREAPDPRGAPESADPVRVYRQPTARAPRRRVALGVVAATAAIAFAVAVIALTASDLVSGGSIGKGGGRTTFFGGNGKQEEEQKQDATPEQARPDQTDTTPDQTPTTDTAPEPPPSDTAPVTPPVDPTGTAPAPEAVP